MTICRATIDIKRHKVKCPTAVEKDLGDLEAKFIENGHVYGFLDAELRTYAEERLKEVEDREERKKATRDRAKLEETIRQLEDRVVEIEREVH